MDIIRNVELLKTSSKVRICHLFKKIIMNLDIQKSTQTDIESYLYINRACLNY